MCCVIPPCSLAAMLVRADRVEERGLAVVDVAEERHDRRARETMSSGAVDDAGLELEHRRGLEVLRGLDRDLGVELDAEQLDRVLLELVVDLRGDAVVDEELLDDRVRLDAQRLGERLHRDGHLDLDLADDALRPDPPPSEECMPPRSRRPPPGAPRPGPAAAWAVRAGGLGPSVRRGRGRS